MKRRNIIAWAAVMPIVCVATAFAVPAFAQQPSDYVRSQVAEERSAHLSSLSDRAVQLRAELANVLERLRATEVSLKEALAKCAEACKEPKK